MPGAGDCFRIGVDTAASFRPCVFGVDLAFAGFAKRGRLMGTSVGDGELFAFHIEDRDLDPIDIHTDTLAWGYLVDLSDLRKRLMIHVLAHISPAQDRCCVAMQNRVP